MFSSLPAPVADPLFYALAIPAVIMVGISKTGLGNGAGAFIVALLALAVPPAQAAGIMLPILCVMDLVGVRALHGHWDAATLRVIVPGALIGIAFGALLFGTLPVDWLRLAIGLMTLLFGVNQGLDYARRLPPRPPQTRRGLFWSAVSGLTSTLAHAGGPPLMVYLLPLRLERTRFVATTVLYFFIVNFTKLVPYALLGQLNGSNLVTALILLPFAPLGVWLGLWLLKRMTDRLFYRLAIVLLVGTGAKLSFEALRALIA